MTTGRLLLTELLFLIITLPLAGCGEDGPERIVVSGAVTYLGEPVVSGRILFYPADETLAPTSGTHIVDGRYQVDHNGGVPVGTHRVEITAKRVDPRYSHLEQESSDVENELPQDQYIPDKYNEQSELVLTVPTGSEPITKNFELTE